VLRPLAVEHDSGSGEGLRQLAQPTGVVEVDVGGDDVFGLGDAQLRGGLFYFGENGSRARLDDGATAVLDEVNGEGGVSAGDFLFQAVGFGGDVFQCNGYFFTSQNQRQFY
jgi:hypothetical protein